MHTDRRQDGRGLSAEVRRLASDELQYLDKRSQFWRQNKDPAPDRKSRDDDVITIDNTEQLLAFYENIEKGANQFELISFLSKR